MNEKTRFLMIVDDWLTVFELKDMFLVLVNIAIIQLKLKFQAHKINRCPKI